jgi:PAS domain S-box-containing protein
MAELATTVDEVQTILRTVDGTILSWNSSAESLYGWSREEAIGRNSHEMLQIELSRPLAEVKARFLEEGRWTGECKNRCRDGSAIWVSSLWILHRQAEGTPVSVIDSDITALKHANEALRASEATVRSLFENASQGILTADRDGHIVDANTMAYTLFGYTRAELIGSSVDDLLPKNLRARHAGQRAAYACQPHARPMGIGMDLVAKRKDGSEFPVEISLSHIAEHPNGGLAIAFISDISARKQAHLEREALISRLEVALSEKTGLLKEVHHRVKNNLAVIAGLLAMQARSITDERAAVALAESQQRVISMSLVHEYLYATEHLDRVNFGEYVETLAIGLCESYALDRDRVGMVIEAEHLDLPVHMAIPCGLILNEFLTNALKYAFPRDRSGKITVHFGSSGTGALSLSCRDNGVGMPEGFDWKNTKSQGLKIIRILTKQIDGELTLDRSEGQTRFELKFPLNKQ